MEDFGDVILVYLNADSEERGEHPIAFFSPRDEKFVVSIGDSIVTDAIAIGDDRLVVSMNGDLLVTDAIAIAGEPSGMGLYLPSVTVTYPQPRKPGAEFFWWQLAPDSRKAWMVTEEEAARLLQAADLPLLRVSFLRLKIRNTIRSLQAPDDPRRQRLPNIEAEEFRDLDRETEDEVVAKLESLAATLATTKVPMAEQTEVPTAAAMVATSSPPSDRQQSRPPDGYRPAKEFLDKERFLDYPSIRRHLKAHPEIRTWKPSPKTRRLFIHAGDWLKARTTTPPDPLDLPCEVVDAVVAADVRKAEIARLTGRK